MTFNNELAARIEADQKAHCPTCRNEDGSINTDYLVELAHAAGGCTFGCGTFIDSDETGMCSKCHEHSANDVECETCAQQYADWGGKWEAYK